MTPLRLFPPLIASLLLAAALATSTGCGVPAPPPTVEAGAPFRMLASNIDWDDYVGRIALGKVESGEVKKGDSLWLLRKDGTKVKSTITKVFEYAKLGTQDAAIGESHSGKLQLIAHPYLRPVGAANVDDLVRIASYEPFELVRRRRCFEVPCFIGSQGRFATTIPFNLNSKLA